MNRRTGLTLMELVISLASMVIIAAALAGSYQAAVQWQTQAPLKREEVQRQHDFENRLRSVLANAYVTSDTNDAGSYFVASNSGGVSEFPDTITFTSTGQPMDETFLADRELDFEGLNETFGPQGGLAEISLSAAPVGEAPIDTGLFLRIQDPADGDDSQGGRESAFSDRVESVQFEFYNGIEWVTEWDTTTGPRRIPAAVRVTYRYAGESADRFLIVRLVHSDVTSENPLTLEGQG